MTISLETEAYPARTLKYGGEKFELAVGEKVRIQKWIDGGGIVDVLAEVTVPAGKAWTASTTINIVETDA